VSVILLHRLQGQPLFVNADLIESVEAVPDTIVTFVDGRRVVVTDSPDDVVRRITDFRAAILVAADNLRAKQEPTLRLVPKEDA
jgi:flagellar protein FlbD